MKQSIRTRQTVAMTTTGSLENQELMPQGKHLSVQRCAGSKSLPNRRKERENDCEDSLSKLSRRPPKFNWVYENRDFRRQGNLDNRRNCSRNRWPRLKRSDS